MTERELSGIINQVRNRRKYVEPQKETEMPDLAGEYSAEEWVHEHAFVLRGAELLIASRLQLLRRMIEASRAREALGMYASNPRQWARIMRLRKAWHAELRSLTP